MIRERAIDAAVRRVTDAKTRVAMVWYSVAMAEQIFHQTITWIRLEFRLIMESAS